MVVEKLLNFCLPTVHRFRLVTKVDYIRCTMHVRLDTQMSLDFYWKQAQVQTRQIIGITRHYMRQLAKEKLTCALVRSRCFNSVSKKKKHFPHSFTALLQHGANPNIRNSEQKTPLDLTDETTRLVLTGEYRKDELLEAARSGAEDRLLALLTPLNVNCHASDGRRSTPLHLAAGYNRIRIVQILLQHGADVHAKDKGGLVPLHNACSYGHFEVTELLIKHGANVNANDLWAFTPLHEAASKSRVEVCSLLLSEGADPTLLNCHNKSAIDSAPTRELQERIACK